MNKVKLIKIKNYLEGRDDAHVCLDCLKVVGYDSPNGKVDDSITICEKKNHTIIDYYDYEQDDYVAVIKFINFLIKK